MADRTAAQVANPNDAWETVSGGDEWETVSGQQVTPPMPPSAAARIGSQALSTIGGGIKAPFQVAGAALKSATTGSPRPLYNAVVAPQVEQFKKAGGQFQRAMGGDLSGIPGAVMYGTAGMLPGFGPLITSAVEQGTPVARGGEGDVPKAVGTLAGGGALAAAPAVISKVAPHVTPHITKMGGPELAPTPAEGVTAMISPKGAAMHYGARQLSRLFKKPKEEVTATPPGKGTGTKYGGPADPGYSPPGTNIPRRGLPDMPPRPAGKGTGTKYGGSGADQPSGPSYTSRSRPAGKRAPKSETMEESPSSSSVESKLQRSIEANRGNKVKKIVNILKSNGITRDLLERATEAQLKVIAKQAGYSELKGITLNQVMDALGPNVR
jgi:hypothetical protein